MEKVVFTFGWDQAGHPIPPGSTTIEISLHPEGEKTLVRLVHRGLPDDAVSDHGQGWAHYLGRLAITATGGVPVPTSRPGRLNQKEYDDESPNRYTRRMARRAARPAQGREGADAPQRRRSPEQRHALPWVRIDKDYRFDTEDGEATLADLFDGRSQLIVYHFMYGPDWDEGCPSCSSVADGFDETHLHLQNHDVAFTAVSRAPLAKLLAYRERMGWTFPWASSARSDFNFDFDVSFTEESVARGQTYNFRPLDGWQVEPGQPAVRGPGHERVRARRRRRVPHLLRRTRVGVDALWNMWQWLDRAPLGRNEGDLSWFRRHDQYEPSDP